jgi:hypothetical protein
MSRFCGMQESAAKALPRIPPAVWTGVSVARRCYARTRKIDVAVLVGALVVSGRPVKTLLQKWGEPIAQSRRSRAGILAHFTVIFPRANGSCVLR